jgi:hypothetical protein
MERARAERDSASGVAVHVAISVGLVAIAICGLALARPQHRSRWTWRLVVLEGVMDWFVVLAPLAVVSLVALLVERQCGPPGSTNTRGLVSDGIPGFSAERNRATGEGVSQGVGRGVGSSW